MKSCISRPTGVKPRSAKQLTFLLWCGSCRPPCWPPGCHEHDKHLGSPTSCRLCGHKSKITFKKRKKEVTSEARMQLPQSVADNTWWQKVSCWYLKQNEANSVCAESAKENHSTKQTKDTKTETCIAYGNSTWYASKNTRSINSTKGRPQLLMKTRHLNPSPIPLPQLPL